MRVPRGLGPQHRALQGGDGEEVVLDDGRVAEDDGKPHSRGQNMFIYKYMSLWIYLYIYIYVYTYDVCTCSNVLAQGVSAPGVD